MHVYIYIIYRLPSNDAYLLKVRSLKNISAIIGKDESLEQCGRMCGSLALNLKCTSETGIGQYQAVAILGNEKTTIMCQKKKKLLLLTLSLHFDIDISKHVN